MPSASQPDFSAGIWRGRKAPAGAVYDVENGLVTDEGNLARRGAASLYSASDAGSDLAWLQVAYVPGPSMNRVLASGTSIYALDGSLLPVVLEAGHQVKSRIAGVGDLVVLVDDAGLGPNLTYYGGSLKTAPYATGTISYTDGSAVVTGSGTSWLANVDPGMLLQTSLDYFAVVKSVDTDVQITLTRPVNATGSAVAYEFFPVGAASLPDGFPSNSRAYVAAAGQLLLLAAGSRVYYSPPGNPLGIGENDFHEIPANSLLVGAEGIGDAALIFTTRGVWRISNLSFDAIDDAGNPQRPVEQVNADIVLWDDNGVAAWDVGLVVPAIDDVYLMALDGSVRPVSEGIRPLYRSYVDAGYQPGLAAVYRGHYLLPILDGATLVDTLVCRLDRPTQTPSGSLIYPWTRLAGQASSPAYAVLVSEAAREPKLLGLSGKRVTDLTVTLDGQGATDANGTDIAFSVTTNDLPLGFGTATDIRATYELASAELPDTFDRSDGLLGAKWAAFPSSLPMEIVSHELAGTANGLDSRSYYSATPRTAPLAVQATLKHRPATNTNSVVYAALGFAADPGGTPGGYEVRVQFEAAADTVEIYRIDNTIATSILSPVSLGSRLVVDDTFGLTIQDGTLTALVNGAVVGTATDSSYFTAGDAGYVMAGIVDAVHYPSRSSIRLDSRPPIVTVEFSSDQDAGAFTALTTVGEQGGAAGWTVSDGSRYSWAKVNKKRERIRFRLTLAGAATSFKVRAVELLSRASGKQ